MPQEWVEYERVSGRFYADSGEGCSASEMTMHDRLIVGGCGRRTTWATPPRDTSPWTPPSESRFGQDFAAMQLAQSVRCHVRHAVRSSGLVRNQPRTADPETVRSPSRFIVVRGLGVDIDPGWRKHPLARWGEADQLVSKWFARSACRLPKPLRCLTRSEEARLRQGCRI